MFSGHLILVNLICEERFKYISSDVTTRLSDERIRFCWLRAKG